MARRRYTDDERAACLAALAANSGDIAKTAREVGVPINTLKNWARGRRHPEATQMGDLKKPALANEFMRIAYQLLAVATLKAASMNGKDAMVAAAVAVDKWLILRGVQSADERQRYDFSRLSERERVEFASYLDRCSVLESSR